MIFIFMIRFGAERQRCLHGEAEIKGLDFLTSQEILHRSKTGGFIAKEI
jgi:hypothetical protein